MKRRLAGAIFGTSHAITIRSLPLAGSDCESSVSGHRATTQEFREYILEWTLESVHFTSLRAV